jgi:hypothetical protein
MRNRMDQSDRQRIASQLDRVRSYVQAAQICTLRMISRSVKAPEASVSARIRDLRAEGWIISLRRDAKIRGLYWYSFKAPV